MIYPLLINRAVCNPRGAGCFRGYLDDGENGANINLSGIPYPQYDVYILLGSGVGDTHNFEVPRVNGVNVLAADSPLSET